MMNFARIKTATVVLGSAVLLASGGTVLVRQGFARDEVHVHDARAAADGKKDDAKAAKTVLDRVIPEVNFDGVALSDAVDFLQDVSGQKIDWKAMQDAGVEPAAPVTARLKGVTLSKAIQALFESAGATEPPSVTLGDKKIVVKPGEKRKGKEGKEAEGQKKA